MVCLSRLSHLWQSDKFRHIIVKESVSPVNVDADPYEGHLHALMGRFDKLEDRLEILINKVIDEVKEGKRTTKK